MLCRTAVTFSLSYLSRASSQTFRLLQGDASVRCRVTDVDSEALLQMLDDAFRSAEPAGNTVAHVQLVAPHRCQVVQAIKLCHFLGGHRREFEIVSDCFQQFRSQ